MTSRGGKRTKGPLSLSSREDALASGQRMGIKGERVCGGGISLQKVGGGGAGWTVSNFRTFKGDTEVAVCSHRRCEVGRCVSV